MPHSNTLLVVEPHRDCREVLKLTLESNGHRVLECDSGGQALASLRGVTPRCIVLDAALPDRPWLDVVRVVRANQRFDAVPVVLVGTWFTRDRRASAQAAGVDAVLLKPFEVDELLPVVRGARSRSRQPQP